MGEVLDMEYGTPIMLNEAGLSRIAQHITGNSVGMITAFRGENDIKSNKVLNKKLKSEIRGAGYGVIRLLGRYVEGYGTDDAQNVDEESFFVVGKEGMDGNLKGMLKKLGKKYKQESILFKSGENDIAVLVGTSPGYPGLGKQLKLGKWNPQRTGEFYSKMKQKSFTFESFQYPLSNNGIQARKLMEKRNG